METIKEKDDLIILFLFAQTLDNYKHNEALVRLMMEINFKWYSVVTIHELIKTQEEEIKKLRKDKTTGARSYEPEMKLMTYLEAYLSVIYALTERLSAVTKIFYGDSNSKLKDGFHKQREQLLKKTELHKELSNLLTKQDWYDLFREVREETTHYGTSFLAWGVDKTTGDEFSQLVIEVGGKRNKKVLTSTRYSFDVRNVDLILKGLLSFMKAWASILVKKLDPKYRKLKILKSRPV